MDRSCQGGDPTPRLTEGKALELRPIPGAERASARWWLGGDARGQRADGWMAEHVDDAEFPAKRIRDQGVGFGQLQRRAAKGEEIVVRADGLAVEHLTPDREQGSFDSAARVPNVDRTRGDGVAGLRRQLGPIN